MLSRLLDPSQPFPAALAPSRFLSDFLCMLSRLLIPPSAVFHYRCLSYDYLHLVTLIFSNCHLHIYISNLHIYISTYFTCARWL
ncbi:hypothetical protein CY34DRAFT_527124 [Suillus luteus UH-Slu-Lm8-n1]|uniref:Uncharacterized protein n=1 Tax=Suillus luteus UH-Slu-Lm8-n1 TaxID=930992 RepID=A0A0D0A3T3_9AGAM|nr:hypothetical protein CY34DRAFT_527124 [Suillus luteus UH-Slu-Lm8-n1]